MSLVYEECCGGSTEGGGEDMGRRWVARKSAGKIETQQTGSVSAKGVPKADLLQKVGVPGRGNWSSSAY